MKNGVKLLFAVIVLSVLIACGGGGGGSSSGAAQDAPKMAVVIAVNGAVDDRSFVQGAWEGMKKFGADNNLSYIYFTAAADSVSSMIDTIELAVNNGIEIIVAPGFGWGAAIFEAQDRFPNLKMVVLDDEPRSHDFSEFRAAPNALGIYFAEQEAGFFAGYGIVKEGYTNLGFMGGMAVPAVVRFGYGFVYGADLAAQEMGLPRGSITIRYYYTGNFDPTPANQTFAASWFASGTEVIFACAGQVGNVVMAAAEQAGPEKIVIGVDVDQAGESPIVITSAMKNLQVATYQALSDWKNGTFKGGVITLSAKEDGTGLPLGTSFRFKKFTEAEYLEIFQKVKNNTDGLASSIPIDTAAETASGLPTKVVRVETLN